MRDPGSYVCVLPSIWAPWTEECGATLDPSIHEHLLVVDNTVTNRGVSASWNDGIRAMYDRDRAWVVFLSAGMRFGEARGVDFFGNLGAYDGDIAVEAAQDIGWHLIAFARHVVDRVGLVDESMVSYFSDLDYSWRIQLAFGPLDPPFWRKVPLDGHLLAAEHGINLGGYRSGPEDRQAFVRKWGGAQGDTLWTHPYGDPSKPVDYWVKT